MILGGIRGFSESQNSLFETYPLKCFIVLSLVRFVLSYQKCFHAPCLKLSGLIVFVPQVSFEPNLNSQGKDGEYRIQSSR
jgi:hypothetical protein